MQRRELTPRANWQHRLAQRGLNLQTALGVAGQAEEYWNEVAHYVISGDEAAAIGKATREVFALCVDTIEHVIEEERFAELGIPEEAIPLIVASWEQEHPSLYARLDFSMQDGVPKLLEVNGDVPVTLLEAAVLQADWKADRFPHAAQANAIHAMLVDQFHDLRTIWWLNRDGGRSAARTRATLHLASMNNAEDRWTTAFLAACARSAGWNADLILMENIGWNADAAQFVDPSEQPIHTLFKLYPWEWLVKEAAAPGIATSNTAWIEPAWKLVLSSKGLLPILWERYPNHPNLLAAMREAPADTVHGWVKKPLFSVQGANVTIRTADTVVESKDDGFGAEGYVYQELAPLPVYDGHHVVVGSWLVGGQPAGIGLRESDGPITDEHARFVPHLVEG